MAITITLDDELSAGLEFRAKNQDLSVEQLAIRILTEALTESKAVTPQEVVAALQARGPHTIQLRPASANLAELLRAASGDPCFDLETWSREWSTVEAELKAMTRANDLAESRGKSS